MLRELTRRIRAPFDRRRAERRLAEFHAGPVDAERAVDLALDFGGRGRYRVRTTQVRSEILRLARRVEALAPRRVLEIGTYRGGTTLLWAQFASERVVTCDVEDRPGLRELFGAFPRHPGCEVTLEVGDSHDAAFRRRIEERFGERGVDFLFIDGDHLEEGVERDYLDYAPLVRPGGLIAFHDVEENQPIETNQVGRFWARLRAAADPDLVEEVREAPGGIGYGIGILRVPESGALPKPVPRAGGR